MEHWLIRATVIPSIIDLIKENFSVSESVALDMFYTSITGANYADDETGLFSESALYIFNLFKEEYET